MLLRLEVENFKSYHGYQTLGPFLPFTAVIGPNGSGKSNLMDAISFVLGVRSTHLRASHLKNLVYGAGTGHAAKKAYVRAVYKAENSENELHFFRSATSTGQSEYRINDKVVSHDQYIEKLESIHVLSKARNFLVFQGDVEGIAAMSPRSLTALFEDISGSGALKRDYEESLAAKEKAEEEIKDFHQKRKGINAEKKQYKEQKEEAEKFNTLLAEKAKVAGEYFLFQLYTIERQIADVMDKCEVMRADEAKQKSRLSQIDKQMNAKRKEHAVDHKQYVKAEDEHKAKQQEAKKFRPKLIKINEQIEHASKKLEGEQRQLAKATTGHKKHQDMLHGHEKELEEVRRRREQFEGAASADTADAGVLLQQAQLDQYSELKEQATRSTGEIQAQLDHATRDLASSKNALQREQNRATQEQSALEQHDEKRIQLEERKQKLEKQLGVYKQQIADQEGALAKVSSADAEDQAKVKSLNEELESVQLQLREAKADKHESERERRAAECYDNIKRLFPGVKGRLIDLCDVSHKRYNVAVTVVMGKNMDAIVVDTEETARACIQYMKEQKAGTATFLPLQTLVSKALDERLRSLGGTKKLVLDVVKFPKEVTRAVEFACGNAVVCDTLPEASELCFSGAGKRYKCVTLDGTLIRKSGVMTGGFSGMQGRASKWEDKAVDDLKRVRNRCQRELGELNKRCAPRERNISDLKTQIAGLRSKLTYMEKDLEITTQKLEDAVRTSTALQAVVNSLNVDGLQEELNAAEKRVQDLERKRDHMVDSIFKSFCKQVGIKNIREYEGKELRTAQERAKQRLDFANVESRLKNQIEYERSRDTASAVKAAEEAVEGTEYKIAELTEKKAAMEKKIATCEEQVKALRMKMDDVKARMDEKDIEMKELKRQQTAQSELVAAAQKNLEGKDADIDQLQSKRHALFQTCRLEEIDLPVVNKNAMEVDDEEDSMTTQGRELLMAREGSIELDYSKLPHRLRQVAEEQDIESENQVYACKLKEITALVDNMAPNMRAGERLDSVRERLKKADVDFEQVRQKAVDADNTFRDIQKKRYEKFHLAFSHVSGVIDNLYKELTKNAKSNTPGGTAYLTLENAEEPYLYGIKYNTMPPSKRFRDMEQLSGGEKTVAALALLFAIHDFRPSPFFVLDEIDAALDAVNVQKVANYIVKSSRDFQCIVISLKDAFYSKADGIVGIYRDKKAGSSRTLTVDLRNFVDA